jgi:ABC-type phosphate/phosphonate transport system substrate-binding protein
MTTGVGGAADAARIMNARMYAVTPDVEAYWRALLEHITREAGVDFAYLPYPAPRPLETLWARRDLGAVFMCGFPIALGLAPVIPIAAPIPRVSWAEGEPVYRTDLIVREDSPYRTLADTFGGRLGWTVSHSQSGFNALRHELLGHRTGTRRTLYREVAGNLVTARNVLDAVREGRIDVGPLDAYWHLLIAAHAPELTRGIRVVASTPRTPIPGFVAAAAAPAALVAALRAAFTDAARAPWFAPLAETLMIEGFAPMSAAAYAPYLEWDAQARAAGYEVPA